MTHKPSSDMLRLQQGNVTSDACIDLIQVPKTNVSIKKNPQPSVRQETIPAPHPFQCTQLMGNWSRLVRSPVQRYQGWEGGVNSGRDASEVKPLIMITNWSWLLERQAAAVGRPAFEVPPACCRVPAPLAWGDAGTMWLPVGKNVMRRQGDGAQDGWRVDGSTGPAGGLVGWTLGTTKDGMVAVYAASAVVRLPQPHTGTRDQGRKDPENSEHTHADRDAHCWKLFFFQHKFYSCKSIFNYGIKVNTFIKIYAYPSFRLADEYSFR